MIKAEERLTHSMNDTHQAVVTPAGFRLPGAAIYLGVSQATVKKLVREQKVRSVKLNRARVFPRVALDDLLADTACQGVR
jgi:excisionase family DNA binding protein